MKDERSQNLYDRVKAIDLSIVIILHPLTFDF